VHARGAGDRPGHRDHLDGREAVRPLELVRWQDAGGGGVGAVSIAVPAEQIAPWIVGFVIGFALMRPRQKRRAVAT
jgi:hypothetical protein